MRWAGQFTKVKSLIRQRRAMSEASQCETALDSIQPLDFLSLGKQTSFPLG